MGRRKYRRTNCRTTFSSGWPLRSYIARKKNGSMVSTITRAAVLVARLPPGEGAEHADERAAAKADQLPLCQVESDLRFNFCQVLGDRNIGHKITLSIGQWALNTERAMLPVLKSVKHNSTV